MTRPHQFWLAPPVFSSGFYCKDFDSASQAGIFVWHVSRESTILVKI